MSGELEAAGAMATAGLAAAVIEGREAHGAGDGKCLNCGAELQGAYCHACGQAAHPHRSLIHLGEEFLHGLIHFDTKAWRTLPMLIGRPGTLTRNYIYGKRARYISPLALFLFCVFAMFAVFAFTSGDVASGINAASETTRTELLEEIEQARGDVREEEAELAEALANPDPNQPAGLEERLGRMEIRLAQEQLAREEAALERFDARVAAAAAGAAAEGVTITQNETGETVVTEEAGAPGNRTWQQQLSEEAQKEDFVVIQGMPELSEKIRHKLQNPDLALYSIQQAAYKFSFLLVPITLPFIALLFLWKRGLTFYDHVVYALYALSFASVLFIVLVLSARAFGPNMNAMMTISNSLLFLALPVHTFFHLKGAYALGWWSALWRTFFMLIFATLALSFWLVAIIMLGLAG